MPFWETGTKGEHTKRLTDQFRPSGVKNIGFTTGPWDNYKMPVPTCSENVVLVHGAVVPKFGCGSETAGGKRWGTCDQWRSSCNKHFAAFVVQAAGLVDAVKLAAGALPGSDPHVTPCTFGDLYAGAMYYIAECVGSYDYLLGLSFPAEGSAAYIPRWASWIYGGDPGKSNYPTYDLPYNKNVASSLDWHGNYYDFAGLDVEAGWPDYTLSHRQLVGDGEFCRQALTARYPCPSTAPAGAQSYPGMCGGCLKEEWIFGCADWLCSHHPLAYYDQKFSELRQELLDAVLLYEGTNKLGSQTIDETCATQIADAVVGAPDIDPAEVDENQWAYDQAVAAEQQRLADRAELKSSLALAGVGDDAGFPTAIVIGGVAALAGIFWLARRRAA
jgi:hypothetical protein